MKQFQLPSPLVLTGNLGENWRQWEQRFQIYMTASGAEEKNEKIRVAILLHALGKEALEVYNTLEKNLDDDNNETVSGILAAFNAHCLPNKIQCLSDTSFGRILWPRT